MKILFHYPIISLKKSGRIVLLFLTLCRMEVFNLIWKNISFAMSLILNLIYLCNTSFYVKLTYCLLFNLLNFCAVLNKARIKELPAYICPLTYRHHRITRCQCTGCRRITNFGFKRLFKVFKTPLHVFLDVVLISYFRDWEPLGEQFQ